jgi:hypothetical protein
MEEGEAFGFGFTPGAGAAQRVARIPAATRSYAASRNGGAVEGCARRDQAALAALYDQSNQLVYSVKPVDRW